MVIHSLKSGLAVLMFLIETRK